jgi:hypothetical protein
MLRVRSEADALWALVALVRARDPDALCGWDVRGGSLGWLLERAAALGVPELERACKALGLKTSNQSKGAMAHALEQYYKASKTGLYECQGHEEPVARAVGEDGAPAGAPSAPAPAPAVGLRRGPLGAAEPPPPMRFITFTATPATLALILTASGTKKPPVPPVAAVVTPAKLPPFST